MPLAVQQHQIHSTSSAVDFKSKFICPEESMRYSGALEQMVFNKMRNNPLGAVVVEFGSGSGSPVVSAMLNSDFNGIVHGYEINAEAAETAGELIERVGLTKQYVIHNESFFEAKTIPHADFLIANPPYIPAKSKKELALPDLYGGIDGNDISKQLLSTGYENVLLLVSSYSNPADLLNHAKTLGYVITDFQITKMSFGVYSRQEQVQQRIQEMKEEGKAFFTGHCYLVGSAFFTKDKRDEIDLSSEFLTSITALGR